ncbi:MogA/MoaB family molybdenum cofactor biosynthesis protein [Anaerococcus tetradius]|uniref:Molybdenum cofactor synthesis domain protein n=1 Tax=Anaerococcus tetradius ATCC 35098 TaxID=525255 RepID=C2CKG0_9FIRM|nr:MogA/MoaB family molybdenum cofactor biosynthesis protein [Anaerococcus tetradius]EEI81925.1 molybdenum cofactor synthesis domain protein [Anaerococcus tetradius ATCC 35098]
MIFTAAVLTISDRASAGIYEDKSGKLLEKELRDFGIEPVKYEIIPDDFEKIKEKLIEYSNEAISLVITSGGTGLSKRDNTPEASLAVFDKRVPGIGEAMRKESAKITPRAYLSRAEAGIRKDTLIINFPGSPKACKENFEIIKAFLIHGLETIAGIDKHNK